MMLREGEGGAADVPQVMMYLAQAASMTHVRALNFLAHALFDPEARALREGAGAEEAQGARGDAEGAESGRCCR